MPITPFKNEPFIDFSNPSNRKKQEAAIQKVEASLGKEFPIIINGEKIFTKESIN